MVRCVGPPIQHERFAPICRQPFMPPRINWPFPVQVEPRLKPIVGGVRPIVGRGSSTEFGDAGGPAKAVAAGPDTQLGGKPMASQTWTAPIPDVHHLSGTRTLLAWSHAANNTGRSTYQSFRTIGAHGRARFSDAFAAPQNVFKQQARRRQTLRRGVGKTSGTLPETASAIASVRLEAVMNLAPSAASRRRTAKPLQSA